jgi:hypothetical protein
VRQHYDSQVARAVTLEKYRTGWTDYQLCAFFMPSTDYSDPRLYVSCLGRWALLRVLPDLSEAIAIGVADFLSL